LLRFSLQSGAFEHESCACSGDPGEKRGLGMAALIDQVAESSLAAEMLRYTLDLDAMSVMILVCVFVIIELILPVVLFNLGIRNTRY
jgi:hypothetical protein